MFTGFFRGVASMGAPTIFEKARLCCTYKGDYESPDENYLNDILQTLAGKDEETRSEIGFRTLLVKMQYSDSLKKWNYIVKNLIILDRSVEERYFLNDISELDLPHIKNYKDEEPIISNILIDAFIQKYFIFIIEKAKIYKNKGNVFNVEKSQNQLPLYLKACNLDKLLLEVSQVQYLNSLIFDIAKTGKKGYLQYKVNQYVYSLLLSSNMNYYTLQYLSIILLIDKLFNMNLSQAEKFKELYLNFIKLTSDLVTFIKNHQFIHGFQISTSEFYKSDAKTITSIEEYIAILLLNSEKEGVVEILDLTPDELEAFKEFEHEEMLKKASNSKFEERKASELRIEKLVSNQKAKEEVAKLVNSNINSPSKRKTSKSSKGIAKNWVKKPILITGINRIEEKVIEETLKNKYKETVLAMPFEKSDYQDLVDITLNKFESENLGKKLSFKRKNSRKESVIEGRKTSKMIKANFMPEFDQKIYETFSNGFSHMFSVQELQLKSGVKDDSMLNKAKKIFF